MTYQASGAGAEINLSAPAGPFQTAPRTLVFSIRAGLKAANVTLDGKPLAALQVGKSGAGWWKSTDAVNIQLADDSKAHKVTLR